MKKHKTQLFGMSILSLIGFVIILVISSCEKNDNSKDYESGKLINLTGLDGCSWVIELDDKSRLEPLNLDVFDLELVENKEIGFKYHERTDMGVITSYSIHYTKLYDTFVTPT